MTDRLVRFSLPVSSSKGKQVDLSLVFIFLGDLTLCIIEDGRSLEVNKDNDLRSVYGGRAVRNPADTYCPWTGMKTAMWKMCWTIDGVYPKAWESCRNTPHDGLGLGPIGAAVYGSFREWMLMPSDEVVAVVEERF